MMVGLAEQIPCFGKLIDIASDIIVEKIIHGLKYVFTYQTLVTELGTKTRDLKEDMEKMSRKIKVEKDNGKIIEERVLAWQKEVEAEIQKSLEELSPSCNCIPGLPIPNPYWRLKIGKNAADEAKIVTELSNEGKGYLIGEIAYLAPVKKSMPKSVTAFKEFESREDIYGKLRDGLVNKDSPLVHGIYGMPGVGKTHTMIKLCQDVMKEKAFDEVVRVDVGNENLENIKLQDKFADRLNCKLNSQNVERRASQLEESLKSKGVILLILDDVWTQIPLDDIIGTPFGDGSSSKGSKILLTSREKTACLDNKCEHPVEIKTLRPDEALYLFKNAVGPDTISSLPDESLVQKVCDECGCLPLVIHAVGKALKGKSRHSWEDAHNQLQKGNFEKIVGVDRQVYAGIKLSIDHLEEDDARSCLFLCSMFPEDANIDMEILIMLATEGESRILTMVDLLKTSSLLLDSGYNHATKIHDIIRDVARSMARTDSKNAFLQVTCNSGCLPHDANYPSLKFLRLDMETADVHFMEDLECPDLHTLWLQSNGHPQKFSGGFFRMFVNLSSLMLENVKISLEQFSLQPLGNLGTLNLLWCDIRKTDVSLFPKNLETLRILYCDLPRPIDVANLKYLRKLEILGSEHDLVMRSNFMSTLSSLKELHIPDGIIIDREGDHTNAKVMEISRLTNLTSLTFWFNDEDMFQGTILFSTLKRYNIVVSEPTEFWGDYNLKKMVPSGRSIEYFGSKKYGNNWKSWEVLMAKAEDLKLESSEIELSSICNGHRGAFEDLKALYIVRCHNMEHLASTSQDEIQYSLQPPTCFSKLTILKIESCSELKYLFCNNIAKGLVQLQELSVRNCKSMEAIFLNDGMSISQNEIQKASCFSKLATVEIYNCSELKYLFCNNIAKGLVQLQELSVMSCESMEAIILNDGTSDGEAINLPKLKILKMTDMWGLRSFNAEKKNMYLASALPMDNFADQSLFDRKVAFPSLETLDMRALPNNNVIWGKDCFNNDILSSFSKLKLLNVDGFDKLEILIPQAMLHRLNNLECVDVVKCSSLRSMFHPSVLHNLRHLKRISVRECGMMRVIIEDGEQVITDDGILFPELTLIELSDLPSLTSFWCYSSGKAKATFRLLQLSSIVLSMLPNLKSFFHDENFEFHTPALKQVTADSCGLSTLFTFSMFRKFQLETLRVTSCEMLENIVEDLRGDETCDKIITLSKLTAVTLSKLPKLKSFFHKANYEFHMPVIETVDVKTCGFSNNLFTCSVFRSFRQLKKLEVSGCELLESMFEDVRGDETSDLSDRIITLFRLSILHFSYLPNLKSLVCSANYECKFPALTEVEVVNCGLFTLFTCSVFQEFQQLKTLQIRECRFLESIVENVGGDEISVTNGMLFPELRLLKLVDLPSLTSFWRYQRGKTNTCKVTFRLLRLSSVVLSQLPDLKSFFHDENFEFHMPALKHVAVVKCGLPTLFTFSMFRKFQLKKLLVGGCEMLENVVEDLRGDETCDKIITLSQLTVVSLVELPKLKSFFHNANYEFHMPVIEEVVVHTCGFPNNMFTRSVFRGLKQLKKLEVYGCELLEGIFEDVKGDGTSDLTDRIITLSRLSILHFAYLPNLKSLVCSANYECKLPALTEVKVVNCGLFTLFTCSVFQEFQQLKILQIRDCRFLESIVENVGDEISVTNGMLFPEWTILELVELPSLTSFWRYQSGKANTCKVALTLQLSSLVLEQLPKLKSFFHGENFEFHIPVIEKLIVRDCGLFDTLFTRSNFRNLSQLEELRVSDCELLEGIFEDTEGEENTTDKIITFNRVSVIHLEGLPKFKSIFHGATYECHMPALKNLRIVGCGLSVLFTCSVFREIQQLEDLHVSDCESMEHIVEEVRGDETSEIKGKSIKSPELSSITLASLRNLKSFGCSPSYVFDMPKLQKLDLWECPQIEYFSSSKTSIPAVRVTIDGFSKEGIQDLNDYIRQNYKRGSYSSDCAGEMSYSSQDVGTQPERIEEEKPQETDEIDQPDSSV